MPKDGENLRLILGLKLKQFRLKKGFQLKDLAARSSLSISFLSEIEKGKKYPKPEKIMTLAQALDISFDDLVSLKVDEELGDLTSLLNSPFLKEFPFELFGVTARDLMTLVTDSPAKAGAFIRTFLEIAQTYDMRVEHFLLAALRSYQKIHLNYFEDLEKAVVDFSRENDLSATPQANVDKLRSIFTKKYGLALEETAFDNFPALRNFRSIWIDSQPQKLIINEKLLPNQKAFILGRELAYSYLELKERAQTSSWLKIESFEQVLNNFKASYFAGALLLNRDLLYADLAAFFKKKEWDGEDFLTMMQKYNATPEMFLYRLSQLIPKMFQMNEIFYLRFNNRAGTDRYLLTKELNMSRVRVPHGIGLNEHYCRRWLALSLLRELALKQQNGTVPETSIAAQRSHFQESKDEFFTITLARPLALTPDTNSSISVGFLINEKFKRTVRFWNDKRIPKVDVNETCERCELSEAQCSERIAPPDIYLTEVRRLQREKELERFINEMKA
ncbi:MAG: helix-turn-helix domain-containing protein [bacterium]